MTALSKLPKNTNLNDMNYLIDRMSALQKQRRDAIYDFEGYWWENEKVAKIDRKMLLVEMQLLRFDEIYVLRTYGYEEGYSSNYAYVEKYSASLHATPAHALAYMMEAEQYWEMGVSYELMTKDELAAFREKYDYLGDLDKHIEDMREVPLISYYEG